jgi:hypothetical protein
MPFQTSLIIAPDYGETLDLVSDLLSTAEEEGWDLAHVLTTDNAFMFIHYREDPAEPLSVRGVLTR